MRYIFVVLLIAVASNALAQNDVLFRVVSFSEGVTIDGNKLEIGANVAKDKKHIEVPPNGYLGGITKDGAVFKITQSTNTNRVMANNQVKKDVPFHYVYQNNIPVSGVSKANGEIVSDSLFVNWRFREDAEDSVTIRFSDVFYNELVSVRVKGNYALLDIGPLLSQSPNSIFEISYRFNFLGRNIKEAKSALLAIRRPNPQRLANIQFDLQRLPQTSERLYLESALYLLNDFTYDSSLCLYKIKKSRATTSDPVLAKYYEIMFDKNDLKSVQ